MFFAIIRLKLLFLFISLFFICHEAVAQTTSVPNDVFENYLETHDASGNLVAVGSPSSMGDGIDDNDLVLTSAISGVTSITLSGLNISNFDGLEGFTSLQEFVISNNIATTNFSINFSGNTQLDDISIVGAPFLTGVNVEQNVLLTRLQVATQGNLFTSIDISKNINLTQLSVFDNQLTSINTDNNLKINFLIVRSNPMTTLNVSHLNLLETLVTFDTQIEILDLSNNNNLTTLLAENGSLQSINLNNGSNSLFSYIDLRNNSNLSCIMVDDSAYSESATNWFKDASASYIDNLIVTEAQDLTLQYDGDGNQIEISSWFTNNGGASALADCGDIVWSFSTNSFIQESSNSIIYEVSFFATDTFGNRAETFATLTVENINHFKDEIYGTGDTICDDVFDLNSVITGIDPAASLNSSDIASYSFSRVPNGESNEGPLGTTYNNTDVDFPDSGAGSYSYLFEVTIEKTVNVYNPETGNLEADSIVEDANITLNDKKVPFNAGGDITKSICPGNTYTVEELTGLLNISPDPSQFTPQSGIDPNNYWKNSVGVLITQPVGAGTYYFDASQAFIDCFPTPEEAEVAKAVLTIVEANVGNSTTLDICEGTILVEQDLLSALGASAVGTWNPAIEPSNISAGVYEYSYDECPELGNSTIEVIESSLNINTVAQDESSSFFVSFQQPAFLDLDTFNNWLSTHGGAVATSTCGDIIWTQSYEVSYNDSEDTVTYVTTFLATDEVESISTIATFTFDNVFVNAGADFIFQSESGIDGGTRCGDDDFSLGIIDGFYIQYDDSATYYFEQTQGPEGATFNNTIVDFPDSGAGQFLYSFNFVRELDVSFPDLNIELYDDAIVTFWVVEPFDVGEDGALIACENQQVTLDDLYNALEGTPSLEGSNFEMSDLWTPSQYEGPGEYVFDFSKVAPECNFNSATVTVTETPNVLDIKVYLQGASMNPNSGEEDLMRDGLRVLNLLPETSPYDSSVINNSAVFDVQGPNAIVDWVLLEFRDGANNTSILNTKSVLLQRDGDIVDVDGASLIVSGMTADYYLTVKHRNHLGIMTANPISLDCSGNTIIDFTDANNIITFGTNAQTTFGLPTNKLGMWTGDTNSDGRLNYLGSFSENPSIRSQVFDDPDNSLFGGPPLGTYASLGYFNTDIDLDGKTKYLGSSGGVVSDVLSIRNNTFNNPSNSLFGGPPISTFVFIQQLPEGAND